MKKMKRLTSLILVLVMVFALSSTVFAAEGTIRITPPTGTASDVTNTYKIYKVFDASGDGTNISYKIIDGKATTVIATDDLSKFEADSVGNVRYYERATTDDSWTENTIQKQLSAGMIEAIATYVGGDTEVATVTTTGETSSTSSPLTNGYYYITTTTGTAVAITSTNPDVTVTDKNVVPTIEKIITDASSVDAAGKNALAQKGTVVNYKVTISVKNGAKGYVFHDTMGTGLTYNSDISIKVDETEVLYSNYTPTTAGDTITISFNDDYIKTLVGKDIVITYSAIVTNDAPSTAPDKNSAYLSYGDEGSNNKTPESETNVYNAKITVTKKDGKNTVDTTDDSVLSGAGFKLKNADDKWYKLDGATVSWVDSKADGTEYTSDGSGVVPAFTGLADGTYTLVETTTPAGFNTAADTTITIAASDYSVTNLEQTTDVINNKGAELPATGGIGTTIFYIVGAVLVLGAVVLLVTKKRMGSSER